MKCYYNRKPIRSMESAQDQSQMADNFTQPMLSSDMPAPSDPRGTPAAGAQSKIGSNVAPPVPLLEPSRPTNPTLLQKRKFVHSRGARPLEDLVGVTQDEKDLMHLWNSFMTKQRGVIRVGADGDFRWVCVAFVSEHGKDLVRTLELEWGWRVFVIMLCQEGLIDANTLNGCNRLLNNISNYGFK